MIKKVLLIDGNSIVNRAFYGVPMLTNSQGLHTNAVYGFFNILIKLIDEDKPDYLAIAFDLKAPTFRHIEYSEYKGTRKGMPDELREQMPMLKTLLTALNIKQFSLEGYEADDILGTLSKLSEEKGYEAVVVSGDRDLLQIASKTLKVRIPKTKGGKTEVEDYYLDDVVEKYGVTPTEFIDVKALMGDSSDNIPGVPGIGEKTATKIIQDYKTIENAIENASIIKPPRASKNLFEFQEQARLSKFLATIKRDVPIELDEENMNVLGSGISKEAYDLFKQWEFKSLIKKFTVCEAQEECEVQIVEKIKYKTLITTNLDEISEYINSIKNQESAYTLFCDDCQLRGINIFNENSGSLYVMILESNILEITNSLKEYFESTHFNKIGINIKKDIHILYNLGINLNGVTFDTAIGSYIINPTKDTYNFDDLSLEFLNEPVKSDEELMGKGKSRRSYASLTDEEIQLHMSTQGEILYFAKRKISEKIYENKQDNLFFNIEMPLIFVLSDMEKEGIKIDRKALIAFGEKLNEEINSLTAEIYFLCGTEFNINSPKQLGVVLFETLNLKGGKKTKTGYSTAADVLEGLKDESPVVEKILLYRQLSKLKSTYVDGLLNVMNKENDKIYSTFNQTITATGRISSTEPNLQNIPIRLELGRELRKVFIPKNENYVFLDADYSQIELRVLGHMAKENVLIEAFKNGQDIHKLTASQVFNVEFDEVTPLQRSNAKAVNFGIVYGIGAFSLGQDLGITRKEAETYIEGYFAKYPNIKTYMDETIKFGKDEGYVATIFNRIRPMPELSSSNFNQRSFGERVAMNMPIQGSAADIIKIAMIKVWEELKNKNLKSKLILQVHDELLIETHKDEVEQVKFLLKNSMENAVNLLVPMEADVKIGNSWFETK